MNLVSWSVILLSFGLVLVLSFLGSYLLVISAIYLMTMARTWNILNWNITGTNDPKKWTDISNKIEESACSVVYLQETKRETFDCSYIRNFCPRRISKFEYLPLIGASRGQLGHVGDYWGIYGLYETYWINWSDTKYDIVRFDWRGNF